MYFVCPEEVHFLQLKMCPDWNVLSVLSAHCCPLLQDSNLKAIMRDTEIILMLFPLLTLATQNVYRTLVQQLLAVVSLHTAHALHIVKLTSEATETTKLSGVFIYNP